MKNCWKIVWTAILSLILLTSVVAFAGCEGGGDDLPPEGTVGLEYSPLSDGSYAVSMGDAKIEDEIVIPASYKGCAVTTISQNGFSSSTLLKSIHIPDSVTVIGPNAFMGVPTLERVYADGEIRLIGNGAFEGCTALESVSIPNGAKSVGARAFKGCVKLEGINVAGDGAVVGDGAFEGCTGLKDITFGEGVSSVGEKAFYGCVELKKITVPSTLTDFGADAFMGCTGLEVTISDIDAWCASTFENRSSNPISGCDSIYFEGKPLTSVVISNGVDAIKDYAFCGAKGITSLTVGRGVKSIGYQSFYLCTDLLTVTMSDVTTIGLSAFAGCEALRELELSSGLNEIKGSAFSGCCSLTAVTIPAQVTRIEDYAFHGCYRLVEVVNKSSSITVTKGSYASNGWVGYYALSVSNGQGSYPSALSGDGDYVIYTDGERKILVGYFGDEEKLILPAYLTEINQYALYNLKFITDVTVGLNVERMGCCAFVGCEGLKGVSFLAPRRWYATTSRTGWESSSGGEFFDLSSPTTAMIELTKGNKSSYWYKTE